jgi:hypothetical protein
MTPKQFIKQYKKDLAEKRRIEKQGKKIKFCNFCGQETNKKLDNRKLNKK